MCDLLIALRESCPMVAKMNAFSSYCVANKDYTCKLM
jgi:hypothetical protein